jgi:two-component system, chemotaxis family, chemotaxis protein CheY
LNTRVLIVDDSSAMRAFVRATLEENGEVDVTEARTGFEALKILPRDQFNLVIVDINMPDINGLELISLMRKSDRYQQTPLLIITTEATARDRERGLNLGANDYLVKPFTPEQLLESIAKLGAPVKNP